MSNDIQYEYDQEDYSEQNKPRYVRSNELQTQRARAPRKRDKSPQLVNGIHRRRRRKMSW